MHSGAPGELAVAVALGPHACSGPNFPTPMLCCPAVPSPDPAAPPPPEPPHGQILLQRAVPPAPLQLPRLAGVEVHHVAARVAGQQPLRRVQEGEGGGAGDGGPDEHVGGCGGGRCVRVCGGVCVCRAERAHAQQVKEGHEESGKRAVRRAVVWGQLRRLHLGSMRMHLGYLPRCGSQAPQCAHQPSPPPPHPSSS